VRSLIHAFWGPSPPLPTRDRPELGPVNAAETGLSQRFLFVGLGAVLVSLIVGALASTLVTGPLRRMARTASETDADALERRIALGDRSDELGQLGQASRPLPRHRPGAQPPPRGLGSRPRDRARLSRRTEGAHLGGVAAGRGRDLPDRAPGLRAVPVRRRASGRPLGHPPGRLETSNRELRST
jgi:HAMP domain-containing protein